MANPRKDSKDKKPRKPKPCPVCTQGIEYVDYKDLSLLKPFLNERAKIKARRTSSRLRQASEAARGGDQERPRDGADPVREPLRS